MRKVACAASSFFGVGRRELKTSVQTGSGVEHVMEKIGDLETLEPVAEAAEGRERFFLWEV